MSRNVLAFALMLGCAVVCVAQEAQTDFTKPILDKASKALGNEDKLKLQGMTFDAKSKFNANGLAIDLDANWTIQGFDKAHVAMNLMINGNKAGLNVVLDQDKAWLNNQQNNKTDALPAHQLQSVQSILRGLRFAQRPMLLLGKDFKLSALGELPFNDKTGVGIKVEQKGFRDLNLYFDKQTGLPLRVELTLKEDPNTLEVSYVFTFTEFKDFDGVKHFTKLNVLRDQQEIMESEISNIQLSENVNANLFAKP